VGANAVLVFYVLAIAKGIYLSLQNRGYTDGVCFFDNFSFEEILPPLKYGLGLSFSVFHFSVFFNSVLHQSSVCGGAIARRGLPNAQPVVLGDLSTGRCDEKT
jgi:hypothetical protein